MFTKAKQTGSTSVGLLLLLVYVAGGIGWFWNIFKIISYASASLSDVTLMFVLRIVGVFAFPLGAILGYF